MNVAIIYLLRRSFRSFRSIKSDRQAGFTLTETLIALFVFSLIAAGTFSALTTTLRTQARLERAGESLAAQASARALIKSDMTHLTLRPVRDAFGNVQPDMLSAGMGTLFSFTRSGRLNPGGLEKRGDLQRVEYLVEDDKFIRRVLKAENPAPRTGYHDQLLYDNVERVDIAFADDEQNYSRLNYSAEDFAAPSSLSPPPPIVNLMVLKIRFSGEQTLVQKFELSL